MIIPSPHPHPEVVFSGTRFLHYVFLRSSLLRATVGKSYLAGVSLAFSYSLCLSSSSSLGSSPVFSPRARPMLSGTGDAGRQGGSFPPFWNPSPSSLLTGLGPEPLLRFGELTYRLELSCAVFRVSRGLAGVIPSPVRCSARRDAQLRRRWSGGRCILRQRLCWGRRIRWLFQELGWIENERFERARRSFSSDSCSGQGSGPPGRGAGACYHSEHVARRRVGGKKPTGQSEFSALRCVWRNTPSGFVLFSPLPPFLPRS